MCFISENPRESFRAVSEDRSRCCRIVNPSLAVPQSLAEPKHMGEKYYKKIKNNFQMIEKQTLSEI